MPVAERDPRRSIAWAWCAGALLLAPAAAAQSGPAYGLLVLAPAEGGAAAETAAALADGLGPPAPAADRTVRRCAAAEGAVTPEMLQAAFDRAQREFFLGRFEDAEGETRVWLDALATGCRPLSSVPEAWSEPSSLAALHDLGALRLAAARELDRTPAADEDLRRLLASFPGARPTDGMFPPSLAGRYLDLEPDPTEVGWVVVEAPGCEVNVAGRIVADRVRVLAGPVHVGVRCPEEDALVVELTLAAGETARLAAPPASLPAGASRGERTLARAAAIAASLAREPRGVAIEEQTGRVRVAAWRAPGAAEVSAALPSAAAAVAWVREALSREPPATESGSDVAWWGPLILGLAGAAAGAGGGWALADAADRRDLAARAATAAEHDGRADEAALLETTGWTLVGVGAAALAGAAVWLAVELAGGGESPADAGRAPHLVPAGPGLAGFGVAF